MFGSEGADNGSVTIATALPTKSRIRKRCFGHFCSHDCVRAGRQFWQRKKNRAFLRLHGHSEESLDPLFFAVRLSSRHTGVRDLLGQARTVPLSVAEL